MSRDAHHHPSFSLSNRVGRLVWFWAYLLLVAWTPRPFHGWRSCVYRCFGARLGRGCHIYARAKVWAPWNLVCGPEVGIADGVVVLNYGPITIGRRSVISQNTFLSTGTHDYEDSNFPMVIAPITIGHHCWVAAQSFLLPGIHIGDFTVVGAGSVVTRSLPPRKVCAGNPCKVIKDRMLNLSDDAP